MAREVEAPAHTIYAWKLKYGDMDVSEAQEAIQTSLIQVAASALKTGT